MNTTLKTTIAALALAGSGAIGLGSLVSAGSADTTTAVTDTATTAGTDTGGPVDAPGARGPHAPRHAEAVAGALGMTTQELGDALQGGRTIADVAADQGVDISVVEQAILSDIQEHLAADVAAGNLTQEEADARLADAADKVTEIVDQAPPVGEPGRRGPGGPGLGNPDTVATTLGLTVEELQTARQAGQSLADLAAEQGVAVDTLVQAIVDDVEAHLADEVTAGDLTQEQADTRLADVEQRVTDQVNATPGEGDCGPGGMGDLGGHGGPGGPRGDRPAPGDAPIDAPADTAVDSGS